MIALTSLLFGVQVAAAVPPTDYSKTTNWLCLPGRSDPCSTRVATTVLNPTGYGRRDDPVPARRPAIDCFYVYPTVSSDGGLNSDLVPGREERTIAEAQMARFSSVCRPFAPVYRQMTVASIAAAAAGADMSVAGRIAYGDVLAAWRDYFSRRNEGRPVVLIGHSQGSLMLIELIAREIEAKPAMKARFSLAILPGYNVLVPQGKLVGGSFRSIPLCSSPGETGCVVAWTSFRENNPPPVGATFGYAARPGMTVGCVNPARWGAKGWVPFDSVWSARSSLPVPGGAIQWSSEGPPPTPYLRTGGLVSGKCINQGARGYLAIRTNSDPKDRRTDRIGGEVGLFGMFLPGWGMHLADLAAVQADLVRAVGEIGRSEQP